jgi:GntR family transcriptional regulator/MocR family aminotransferase
MGLQNQIRQKLVDGILSGSFPPGMKLPSSRKLARQLDVARNTVVGAYQQLVADGYLVSRQRSGIFVNEEILQSRVGHSGEGSLAAQAESAAWARRVRSLPARWREAHDQPNWRHYPYPYLDGKFDTSLFPLAEWREANRLALSVADVNEWSTGSGDTDDPKLIEEIRTKILTRRGIQASADEILITMGTQNSLYLISQMLADSSTTFAVEEPGNFEMRNLLRMRGADVVTQPVDDNGIVVDEELRRTNIVYVTPSHQIPTAVAMSLNRRQALIKAASDQDFLIVEDDYECETNDMDHPLPALRSMDNDGRVIYVASLSKALAPGVRLGFIVANPDFIRRARQLRRKILNHPPLNNQRTTAYFLSLGHYDSLMLRLGRVFRERRVALQRALNNVRGVPITPRDFDVANLIRQAEQHGILVEPVEHYYANRDNAENCIRMGVTSLAVDKIRPGVERLVGLIRDLVKGQVEHVSTSTGRWLTGSELQQVMSGATVLYREVHGAPCTIDHLPDGTMTGRRGYANEDSDTGSWRVDGELLYRKWDRWVYGEETAYYIVIDGDKIKYFNSDKQIVDSAFIRLNS